jgi:hypothetical protein
VNGVIRLSADTGTQGNAGLEETMRSSSWVATSVTFLCVFFLLAPKADGAQARYDSAQTQEQFSEEAFLPANFPGFLQAVYLLAQEPGPPQAADISEIINQARDRVGETEFEKFLERFGIERDNDEDIALEVMAQIARLERRKAYQNFAHRFEEATPGQREELVKESASADALEYALGKCEENQFEKLVELIRRKEFFGPHTPEDAALLDSLMQEYRRARDRGRKEKASRWRAVIAQLASQPAGRAGDRLPFSKDELFAMMRNAERTIEQRKSPFIDISVPMGLEGRVSTLARQVVASVSPRIGNRAGDKLLAYAYFDKRLASKLVGLQQTYADILSNSDSGQSEPTRESIRKKEQTIETMRNAPQRQVNLDDPKARRASAQLVLNLLKRQDQPHRVPFIRGIILLQSPGDGITCRLIEEFPMIVAGATYPYQWKHDNEVNIALLLANTDPYQAAQAVRFIIYHGMWRSEKARELGLYGWLPQIIFGDRQTGELPQFDGKTSYYFPGFRFRPTKEIDRENERNRTSEIMQLPFFGWTVGRIYEELRKINPEHAVAFLKEVYPYVRANTEAIRTALDPFNEGVLSGRDAWVNGMDNAFYHLIVMRRHLPERLMPAWAKKVVNENRVDNREGKCPGCPEDPMLLKGRPSDYYYQFKIVFYDIARASELDPLSLYHATPYNAKDVAITGVMARSLEAQIAMARVLGESNADVRRMSSLRGREDEIVGKWDEEISRYETYLSRMKQAVNLHQWSPQEEFYFNLDVTHMFRSAADLFFCRPVVHDHNDIGCEPRREYWTCEQQDGVGRSCRLNQKALATLGLDEETVRVRLNSAGHVEYQYSPSPMHWEWVARGEGEGEFRPAIGTPFLPEQFAHPDRASSGELRYEPNEDYWTCSTDGGGSRHCRLNEQAMRLLGRGARRIEEGDLIWSPGIAGFFWPYRSSTRGCGGPLRAFRFPPSR